MKPLVARAALALLVLVGSCEEGALIPRTQVLLQIDAQAGVRARADTLIIALASGKGEQADFEPAGEERFVLDSSFTWPASLALIPKDGDASRSFYLEITAQAAGKPLVVSRVLSSFLEQRTLLLEIVLDDACVEYFDCDASQTCFGDRGRPSCKSAVVDPTKLRVINSVPDKRPPPGDDLPDGSVDARVAPGEQDSGNPGPNPAGPDAAMPPVPDAGEAPDGGPEPCVPAAEACFNGIDDDCDRAIDCADPDCDAGATCVDDADLLGVLLPAGATCPPGYASAPQNLHAGLLGGQCRGCLCQPAGPTTCTAQLTAYEGSDTCDTLLVAATASLSSYVCNPDSPPEPVMYGLFDQLEVGAITATPGACPASGTAQPDPPRWQSDATFCALERKGGGCENGGACVPNLAAGQRCAEREAAACAAPRQAKAWYTGYEDTRSCGTCTCVASGASCAGLTVHFGNDYSCTDSVVLGENQQLCGHSYSPIGRLVGTPVSATCTATAANLGSLVPTGATPLCCDP